jgi:predicted dehydrogenase
VLLGYTYRWWPSLRDLRQRLASGEIGHVLHAKLVMSAHLADWHPWESYQDFFMASRELGGGALLDESHFLDLALWFFGTPEAVIGRVERISPLEIDTDDNVDALLMYKSGLRVWVHLDLYGRPHEKYMTFTGTEGTLHWSFEPNCIRLAKTAAQEWADTVYTGERNDMFVAAAAEFIQVLSGREPSCTLDDGCHVLQVIEALRESSQSGSSVPVSPRFTVTP